jgi:hypothetical protein
MAWYGMEGRTRGRSFNCPQCRHTRDFDLILGIAKPRGWTDDRRLVHEGRMHVPYPASLNLRKLMIDGVLRLPHKNHKTEKEAEPDVCMDSY